MLEAILPAVACVAGIGLLCAVVLVVAAKLMSVRENALEKKLRECLPGVFREQMRCRSRFQKFWA